MNFISQTNIEVAHDLNEYLYQLSPFILSDFYQQRKFEGKIELSFKNNVK